MKKYTLTLLLILSFLLPLQSQERVERSVCNSTVEFVINTNKFVENDNYRVFITKTIPFIREHAGGLVAGKYYHYIINITSTGNGTNDPTEAEDDKDKIDIVDNPIVVAVSATDYTEGTITTVTI